VKEKFNLLDVIPYQAEHITTERDGDTVTLAFPRFRKEWTRRLFLPKKMSPHIRVKLEEYGTAVWALIDGHRTVGEIVELMAEHFDDDDNYQQRVTAYIVQLQKDGFIKYRIKMN